MPRSGRIRRVRAGIGEHKKAVLGVLLLMLAVSLLSMLATQYIMSYIKTLGFELIAVVSLFAIAILLFAVESRMHARAAVARVRSRVRGLRRRRPRRRPR